MHSLAKFISSFFLITAVHSLAGAWDESPFMTQEQREARAQAKADSLAREMASKKTELGTKSNDTEVALLDSRDKQIYKVINIEGVTFMAEDLAFAPGSVCPLQDGVENCKKGRYYTWISAKNACPEGWHLPSASELALAVHNPRFDNTRQNRGYRRFNGDFFDVGTTTVYWTSDSDPNYQDYGIMWASDYGRGWVKRGFYKQQANSVRCVLGNDPNAVKLHRSKSKSSAFDRF